MLHYIQTAIASASASAVGFSFAFCMASRCRFPSARRRFLVREPVTRQKYYSSINYEIAHTFAVRKDIFKVLFKACICAVSCLDASAFLEFVGHQLLHLFACLVIAMLCFEVAPCFEQQKTNVRRRADQRLVGLIKNVACRLNLVDTNLECCPAHPHLNCPFFSNIINKNNNAP